MVLGKPIAVDSELKALLEKAKERSLSHEEELQHWAALRTFIAGLPSTQRVWADGHVHGKKIVPAWLIYDQITGEIFAYIASGENLTPTPMHPRYFFARHNYQSVMREVLEPETTYVVKG